MRSLLALAALLPATALAQAPTQTPDQIATLPLPPLDEIPDNIIVTATRRPDSALTVAATVNTLTTSDLAAITPLHPAEALNTVAGVGIHQGSGQEHLTAIRSPVLTGGAGAGSFLYLEDGVPLRAAGFGNVNGLFEAGTEFAQTIEVFKGPGSVLYGSNAQHGLVNILTRAPDGSGSARLLASDDGQAALTLSHSVQKIDEGTGRIRSGTRLSLDLAHDSGFRDDSGYDQQKFQWRHDQSFGAWDLSALTSVQNLNQETAGFLQEGFEAYRDRDLIEINAFPEAFRDAWSARTQARLSRDTSFGSLAVTPFARINEIDFLRHFVPGQAREQQRHASVGALTTLYGNSWIAGLDAEYTEGSLFEFQSNPTRFSFTQGLHYDYDVDALVLSPYAQKAFPLGPRTTLTAGARLDYTRYAYTNNADVGQSGRFLRIADRVDDFVTLTPKLDLVHELDPRSALHARLARGARAPQTSDLYSLQTNQVAGEIDPETLDLLEVGYKYRSARLTFDASAYAMQKDNFFFRNADGFNVTNGETEHLGVELSLGWQATPWLRLDADAALSEQTYTFTDLVASPSSSITSGDDIDSAPHTLARLGATLTPTDRLRLDADLRHVGSYATDPGNTSRYPGHKVASARVAYRLTERVAVFAHLKNAFATRYADRADFAFGNDRYFPGRPRHLLFGITADWE